MFNFTVLEYNRKDKTLEVTKGKDRVTLSLGDMGQILNSESFKEFLEESQKYYDEWE